MEQTYKINAIYNAGMFKLLGPINLKEGTQVKLNVELQMDKTETEQPFCPSRFIPAKNLTPLVGIVSIGGDSLHDSEALYGPDWD